MERATLLSVMKGEVAVTCLLLLFCALRPEAWAQPASMGDFWSNEAHFEAVSSARFPTDPDDPSTAGANVGFYFVPVNGTWFLFHREYFFGPKPSYCGYDYARIVVRTSTDKGVSWSNKTVIAEPQANTATECAIVDGSAHFDASTSTWHYLGQCLGRDAVWNMCHFSRQAADPRGPFVPSPHNPVVRSGQLWSSICAGSGKHCVPGMGSEGTPDIVAFTEDAGFLVTFHGWDPQHVQSARGVAATKDFVTWTTTGPEVPGDAIFTSTDCNSWNISWAKPGCVGGGEGSILMQDGYYYELIEAPDITLGCETKPGVQNWVLGLLRSQTFKASGEWQQMDVAPVVVPVVKQGCYIQYHRLFADAAGVYLEFWADNWMQVFQLVSGSGSLPIVAGPPHDE